ncbi:MAG: exonuclease domain-containing protein [Verrucomicrobiaceae bacterium]
MKQADWILLDTETTGFAAPIYVVEVGAQRMRGWAPVGLPFRKLINQNQDIPPEAARVHGYTREILERDGESVAQVYAELRRYVGTMPIVAYNLEYDLEKVLKPEWQRLGITPMGEGGFCALRLAQRLLDPVPAGNCKLQTLRQYYRLPERGAHTALGDVETVADLFAKVLRPIAEQRGLDTWAKLKRFAEDEWYPSRIAFGKFKGRSIYDARSNPEVRKWLEWLANSSNERSASMGRWYLRQLDQVNFPPEAELFVAPAASDAPMTAAAEIVLYVHPSLQRLRDLIAGSRARLAELEAGYTSLRNQVMTLEARIFHRLRTHFEERDRLRLVVRYRQVYLDVLLAEGEEAAAKAQDAYKQAEAQAREEYEATKAAMESNHRLSAEEESELKRLWRDLVKVFHPDRYADDPEKQEAYTNLTGAINAAKDCGDLDTLRQIANDPTGYMLRQGWAALDLRDTDEVEQLQKLLNSLEAEILTVIEATDALKEGASYELCQVVEKDPEILNRVIGQQISGIAEEVEKLKIEADRLNREIAELSGDDAPVIG